MDANTAQKRLREWDKRGRYVFPKHMLRRIFWDDSEIAFDRGLARLIDSGTLVRACRGVYVYPHARCADGHTIEHVVIAMRPTEYNYVSLESALSEYGAISQIPMGTLTVMTSGQKGKVKTPYGIIEFTHTDRPCSELVAGLLRQPGRPLRIAREDIAWRDLVRVRGRAQANMLVGKEEMAV